MKKTYMQPSMAMLTVSSEDLISTSLSFEQLGKGDSIEFPKVQNLDRL